MRIPLSIAVALTALVLSGAGGAFAQSADEPPPLRDDAVRVLAFAPGQAATRKQAQPTMDSFASILTSALGWGEGGVVAGFEPKLDRGLETLRDPKTAFVMVPLPAYLEFRDELELEALLSIVYQQGADDRWSLVAPKGRVKGADALEGWTLTGAVGYSPTFVRAIALADWGELPAGVTIEPTSRVLSSLRKASKGEDVAVLVDREQAASLDKLRFGAELEVVARSSDVPGFVFCRVGGRLDDERVHAMTELVASLSQRKEAADVLAEMRITTFRELDRSTLTEFEARFDAAR